MRAPMGRGEAYSLLVAALFFAVHLALCLLEPGLLGLVGRSYLFLPAGLLALGVINIRLQSRVLSWGLFALSFVLLVMVFGPVVLQMRFLSEREWINSVRILGMYLALAMTGLFQIRKGSVS